MLESRKGKERIGEGECAWVKVKACQTNRWDFTYKQLTQSFDGASFFSPLFIFHRHLRLDHFKPLAMNHQVILSDGRKPESRVGSFEIGTQKNKTGSSGA